MSVHNKEIGVKRTVLSASGGIEHFERVEKSFNEMTQQLMMGAKYSAGNLNKYKLLDDAYRGSGGFEDGTYLVPFPVEKAYKYARRQDLAYYINFIKPIIDSHVNPIFKSDPVRDNMSDTFKLFLDNVDGNNTTLTRFMKKAAIRAKLHGVEFIVIDAPKVDPNVVLTKKRIAEERIYPYLYLVSPSQVTKYSRDKFGRLISITYTVQNEIIDSKGEEAIGKPIGTYITIDIKDLKIVTCHLGQGSSICAVEGGKSINTSIGLTPLGGIPMVTRSGDLDPSIVTFLMKKEGLSADEVEKILNEVSEDERIGVKIILKALEEPIKQIATNAGLEGAVILDKVKNSKPGVGFDAAKEEYVDMKKTGIVDPTKVTRSALQNAESVASMILTTESVITNKKEKSCGCGNHGMDIPDMSGMY